MENRIEILAAEFHVRPDHAQAVVELLDEGNTVPFIARYRKERHGAMDDQTIRALSERLQYLRGLDQRRDEVKAAISQQEKMTPELEAALDAASTLTEVEDLYRPFRPKRKTRASVARERGLEPLAQHIFTGMGPDGKRLSLAALEALAARFVDGEKGVPDLDAALQGAKDILAEDFSDDAAIRKGLRERMQREGAVKSAANTE